MPYNALHDAVLPQHRLRPLHPRRSARRGRARRPLVVGKPGLEGMWPARQKVLEPRFDASYGTQRPHRGTPDARPTNQALRRRFASWCCRLVSEYVKPAIVMTTLTKQTLIPPRLARSRGHSHHARGGRPVQQSGAAVLRRQGFDVHAAPRRKGLSPGPLSVSR